MALWQKLLVAGAGALVVLGAGYAVYVESADRPGERVARARGCLLCHRDAFEELLPCLCSWSPGSAVSPALTEALQQAHPLLSRGEETALVDFLRMPQLTAWERTHRGNRGERLYRAKCAACHGAEGEGKVGQYPPLRGSEWLTEQPSRLPEILKQGLRGPIHVRGVLWDATMLAPGVSEGEESDVLTEYLRSSFAPR